MSSKISKSELSYANFDKITSIVAEGIWNAIKYARGTCVSFTPKKVLEYANIKDTLPVVLTLVKHVLEELVKKGLIEKDTSRSITRYRICKTSELWSLCKETENSEKLLKLLKTIIE